MHLQSRRKCIFPKDRNPCEIMLMLMSGLEIVTFILEERAMLSIENVFYTQVCLQSLGHEKLAKTALRHPFQNIGHPAIILTLKSWSGKMSLNHSYNPTKELLLLLSRVEQMVLFWCCLRIWKALDPTACLYHY